MKKYSLHIGVNKVNSQNYRPLNFTSMPFAENDAKSLADIMKTRGYSTQTLLTNHATLERFKQEITRLQSEMPKESTLVISFSGHGYRWTSEEENDGYDEFWALQDYPLQDDELSLLLAGFDSSHKIVVIADCCYAGGFDFPTNPDQITKLHPNHFKKPPQSKPQPQKTYLANLLVLAACSEKELTRSTQNGSQHNLFTYCLLQTINSGKPFDSYVSFFDHVKTIYRSERTTSAPVLLPNDPEKPLLKFQVPFI